MPEKFQLRMIAYSAVLVLLFVVLSYIAQNRVDATENSGSVDSIRTVRMTLEGLNELRVAQASTAFESVPGVIDFQLLADREEAVVMIDLERTSIKKMQTILQESGFTPVF